MGRKSNFEVGFVFGAKKAVTFDKTLTAMEKGIAGLNNKISGMVKAAAGIAVGVVGVSSIKDAAQTYGDFQQSMANVQALSGATGETFEALEAKALEMGKKTSRTAKEAADALGYMSLAGWDANTSMNALEPVLRLSEAGGLDLARTSDLVTDSMSAIGLQAEQLPGFLDKVAQTSRKSNTNIDMMMEAYIKAGDAMKGMPLEETSAALGVLANRGLKGAEAGTSIASLMANFKLKSGQAYKALQELGVSAYDAQGNFKGIQATMQELNAATKDMSQQERDMYFAMIGGKEQVKTLNSLMSGLNTVNTEGVSEFDALKTAVVGSDGALMGMADTMNNTLQGAMARARSAVDDLKINAFKKLEPYVTPVINWFAEALPKATEKFCDGLGAVFDAFGGVVSLFQEKGFSGAIESMFGEDAGRIAAKGEECVASFVGGLNKAIHGDLRGGVVDIASMLGIDPTTAEKAFDLIATAASGAAERIGWAIDTVRPVVSWVITDALPKITGLLGACFDVAIDFGTFIADNWSAIRPILIGIGTAFTGWRLVDTVGAGAEWLDKFGGKISALPSAIGKAATAQKGHIKWLVKDKIETLKLSAMFAKDFVVALAGTTKALAKQTAAWVVNKAQLIGQKAVTLALKGVQLISAGATAAMTAAQWALNAAFVASPIGWVVLGIGALVAAGVLLYKNWDTVKAKAFELWSGMKSAFGEAISWFQGIWAGVTGAFDNFMTGLSAKCPILADIIMVPVNTIKGILDGLKQAFSGVVDFVAGVFTGNWSRAWEGVKDIFGGTFESFTSLAKTPINGVIAIINGAIRGINKISVDVPEWVPGFGGEHFGFSIPEIPALAQGGIATAPTLAVVGEGRENEAILPLSKLEGLLSRAKADKAASKVDVTVNVQPPNVAVPAAQPPEIRLPDPPASPALVIPSVAQPAAQPDISLPRQAMPSVVQSVSNITNNTQADAPSPVTPIMDTVRQLLDALKGQKPAVIGGGNDEAITFSPNITVTVEGNGDEGKIAEAVKKAMLESYEVFKQMYEKVAWEKNRTSFSH